MSTTEFGWTDSGGVASFGGTIASFFVDDAATSGGESSPGAVTRIRIYDVALTAAQVSAAN